MSFQPIGKIIGPKVNYRNRGRSFDAFKDGFYERIKVKRHYQTKYDIYHYWLPAKIMPVVRFLKDYFRFLDGLCDTPEEFRYRKTEYEYAETAILLMHFIRNRISVSDPIVIGSKYICPIPWACFGPSVGTNNRIFRNRFITLYNIFDHYDKLLWGRGYNIASIERPLQLTTDRDPLLSLAGIYERSANYVLATAFLLTADIIRNGGPDCGELRHLFTNDKRYSGDDHSIWTKTRDAIIEPRNIDFGELWVKHGGSRSNISSQKFCYLSDKKKYDNYWDVEVRDVFSASHYDLLTHGESVEYHGELQPVKRQLLLPAPDNYKNLSKSDLSDDEDTEIYEMEQRFDEIMKERQDWIEMVRDWSDELGDL